MRIGGFQKFSLIDYPGKVCCIVFTQGCNFRCGYCHNPDLVYPHLFSKTIPVQYIFDFLRSRKRKLDGVAITGGEPTLQKDLIPFIKDIKKEGFLVKLDSNGSNPQVLQNIFSSNLIDYIAMDIKGPFQKYNKVCAVEVDIKDIKKSIRMIEHSGISYEFRTTYDTDLLEDKDLQEIRSFLDKPNSLNIQKCLKRDETAVV